MAELTERKKADRAKMATAVIALAEEFGIAYEVEKEGENSMRPRRWQVSIVTPRGLACSFDFDGQSCQHDVFVNAWHTIRNTDVCLSDAFPGEVNRCHFGKSTTLCYGFDELCAHIRKVLEMAANGSAFDAEREAAAVAKDGTWQERAARFDLWRAEMQAAKA